VLKEFIYEELYISNKLFSLDSLDVARLLIILFLGDKLFKYKDFAFLFFLMGRLIFLNDNTFCNKFDDLFLVIILLLSKPQEDNSFSNEFVLMFLLLLELLNLQKSNLFIIKSYFFWKYIIFIICHKRRI